MNIVVGNLFDHLDKSGEVLNVVVHGCNAQGVMGSGFAKELRERYPEAYEKYHDEYVQSGLQMGEVVFFMDHETPVLIANAITQEFYGRDGKKYVSYDAIHDAFKTIIDILNEEIDHIHIHFPAIGSGLGGGSEAVINTIISEMVDNANIKATLYKLK